MVYKKGISTIIIIISVAVIIVGIVAISLPSFQIYTQKSVEPVEKEQQPAEEIQVPKEPVIEQEHVESSPSVETPTFRNSPEIPFEYEIQQLPDCSGAQFSIAPVDLNKVNEITPLGNLGPPGHTFPTEHVFLHVNAGGSTTGTIPLYAPADVYLTLISFSHGVTQDPVDYTIWFTSCKDVIGYYNHVKELSDELEKIVTENECSFQGESKSTSCHIETFQKIKSNSLMGQVGRLQGNWDFGVFDLSKTLTFANPSRYGTRSFHIQCPFDYYDQTMQKQFFDLIARDDAQQCGIIAQDVPGTLKGNWFFGDSHAASGSDWDKYLAFVDDNENPNVQVVSVGGVFTDAGKWEFFPQTSGLIKREFSDVTPDGNVYCYEDEDPNNFNQGRPEGRILVEMTSETELKIEHQSGSCDGNNVFNNPTRPGDDALSTSSSCICIDLIKIFLFPG